MKSLGYLRRKKINAVKFPPYSPDLNMVERIWALLNKKVSRYGPFQNADELRAATQRAWADITMKEVNDVCRDFKSQVEAVFSKMESFAKEQCTCIRRVLCVS